MTKTARDIAADLSLDTAYLDVAQKGRNCPGFQLWDVVHKDSEYHYIVAGDSDKTALLRIYFRTNGKYQESDFTITLIGPNPDVDVWETMSL